MSSFKVNVRFVDYHPLCLTETSQPKAYQACPCQPEAAGLGFPTALGGPWAGPAGYRGLGASLNRLIQLWAQRPGRQKEAIKAVETYEAKT